jgi:iron-sulfur cluster assembly protein
MSAVTTLPNVEDKVAEPQALPIIVTPKAAQEVMRIIAEQQAGEGAPERIYLRVRVLGGGCSGLQHKLDLDPQANPKMDDIFEAHGVPIVIDRRSMMYLQGVTVDFHDEISRRGFSVSNPNAKTTCGCGSPFSV